MNAALLALIVIAPGSALAAEDCKQGIEPIECLTAIVEFRIGLCQMTARNEFDSAKLTGKLTTEYLDCIAESRAKVQRIYAKALPIAQRDNNEAALKEYSAMALAALSGITPSPNEPSLSYRQRQANVLQALRLQGERVKLK